MSNERSQTCSVEKKLEHGIITTSPQTCGPEVYIQCDKRDAEVQHGIHAARPGYRSRSRMTCTPESASLRNRQRPCEHCAVVDEQRASARGSNLKDELILETSEQVHHSITVVREEVMKTKPNVTPRTGTCTPVCQDSARDSVKTESERACFSKRKPPPQQPTSKPAHRHAFSTEKHKERVADDNLRVTSPMAANVMELTSR